MWGFKIPIANSFVQQFLNACRGLDVDMDGRLSLEVKFEIKAHLPGRPRILQISPMKFDVKQTEAQFYYELASEPSIPVLNQPE